MAGSSSTHVKIAMHMQTLCRVVKKIKTLSLRYAVSRFLTLCVLTMLGAASGLAQQNIDLTLFTFDLYSGVNYSGVHTNGFIVASTNGTAPVYMTVLGAPAGATITLYPNVIYPEVPTINYVSNILMVIAVTNVAAGDYPLTVRAWVEGVETNNETMTLHVGDLLIWRGQDPNNVEWSASANWGPAQAPTAGSNIKFENDGVITNYASHSITLGRLSYVAYANLVRETVIAPGATVLVTNGFIANNETAGPSKWGTNNFVGSSGASLIISNPVANCSFNTYNGSNLGNQYDLSRLDNFIVDANRFGIADVSLVSEGSVGTQGPRTFSFARTNVIRAWYSVPMNEFGHFTNSIQIWNNEQAYNNGANFTLLFGLWNAFFADSFVMGRCRVAGGSTIARFNTALMYTTNVVGGVTNVVTNSFVAYFRNTNGGRMSFFGLGVDSGTNAVSSGSGAQADFTGGTLDMLVDTIWLARNRVNSTTNAQARFRGFLTFSNGIVDANVVRLGYKQHVTDGRCEGRITINGPGTLVVNDFLELGYYAGAYRPDMSAANGPSGFGELVVQNGGTARINRVLIGTGSGASTPNGIVLASKGHLILSNTIGPIVESSPTLSRLSMSDAELTVHIRGLDPVITVSNLVASVPASRINVALVTNVGTYPVTIPIVSYDTCAAANFVVGRLPSGLVGSIVNNTMNKAIELTLTTNVPKVLVWRGNVSSDWDTTTKNWVTVDGGIATNFTDGDFVVFDDTAVRRTVNIAVDVQPGQSVDMPGILVSNSAGGYTFGGWGRIVGGTRLVKVGTGSLVFDATYEGLVEVVEGSMSGSGEVGTVTVGSGGRLDFGGRISGGLVTAGPVRVLSSGEVVGPVTIQTGGSVTNFGVIRTLTAQVTMQAGSYLVNAAGGLIDARVPWNVPADSTLVNNGVILLSGPIGGNQGLNINAGGTLMGTGLITLGQEGMGSINDARVNINAGGRLIIGNAPNQIAGMGIATRLDFFYGSQTIFDVDPAGGNDVISNKTTYYGYELPGKVNFGANNSQGGTLYINRVGSAQFTPGQVLYLFDRTDNTPDNSIPAPPGVTPAPGPGLAWDISDMITNLTLRVGVPPVLTRTLDGGTNLVFSWPWSYRGWRLERQTNSLSVGLSTNWVTVPGSFVTNYVVVPVGHGYTNFPPNSAIFYRLAYP